MYDTMASNMACCRCLASPKSRDPLLEKIVILRTNSRVAGAASDDPCEVHCVRSKHYHHSDVFERLVGRGARGASGCCASFKATNLVRPLVVLQVPNPRVLDEHSRTATEQYAVGRLATEGLPRIK